MPDFTPWLYAHYIKPYIDQCPTEGYKMELCLPDELDEHQQSYLNRILEFYSSRAFLLGVKTGAGLRDAGV